MTELVLFRELPGSGVKGSGSGASIAVVGGGVAGITCARMLAQHGFAVTVYEKEKLIGGRASILPAIQASPDHGCPFFSARDKRFVPYLEGFIQAGIVSAWPARIASCLHGTVHSVEDEETMYVGVPGMNAMSEYLARGLNVRTDTIVSAIKRSGTRWKLFAGGKRESFDGVVVSAPAEQSAQLLQSFPSIAADLASIATDPCWTLVAGFDHPLSVAFDAAHFNSCPITWAANNRSKPGRARDEVWTIHASSEWTSHHLNAQEADVAEALLSAFFESAGLFPSVPAFTRAHRWYYGKTGEALRKDCLWDKGLLLGACGDWCGAGRLDGAFLSGLQLAEQMIKDCRRPAGAIA